MTDHGTSPIAGFTSTGSKHPRPLFGRDVEGAIHEGLPVRMAGARGVTVTDDRGREYLDFIMALGAVSLGYGHPAVNAAVHAALDAGGVGPLAPLLEEQVAERLCRVLPGVERIRFFKTGAEAVAAAVRIARVRTGRDQVIGCGYHGWLDWCSAGAGVPAGVQAYFHAVPFNDAEAARLAIRGAGDRLACVVIEPVIEAWPDPGWLEVLREETARTGSLLVLDEIKTAFRLHKGGAAARFSIPADLIVVGKALANGFPLAAVGGAKELMAESVSRTWISSTLATEYVSLAAAGASLDVMAEVDLPRQLEEVGRNWIGGIEKLARAYPDLIAGVRGVPAMSLIDWRSEDAGSAVTRAAARNGLLIKRSAYNFMSLAHQPPDIARALDLLRDSLEEVSRSNPHAD
ncbi:MAG: aminotransferase class III-fold pyridoxal phosphate-dependent enzyme [Gemmatimonadales bacterium]